MVAWEEAGGDCSLSIVANVHGEALPVPVPASKPCSKPAVGAFCCAWPHAGVVLC